MKTNNSFTYDGVTLDLFFDWTNEKYSITVWTKKGLTQYVHYGIESIYEAGKLFETYKLDILRHGRQAVEEGV